MDASRNDPETVVGYKRPRMTTRLAKAPLRAVGRLRRSAPEARPTEEPRQTQAEQPEAPAIDIAPNDPIIAYFQSVTGAVDVDSLELDSPAVEALKAAGVRLAVPLVTHGELIGVLNLGPRLSEQDYSSDDHKLLENLAAQAAPAVRVGQLVAEQAAEVRSRERMQQELQVAQLIQQNFLPKELPEAEGWRVAAFYRPAREVGGDFYDFIELPEDRLGIVIGDVTDKGVPAAMVMAATRSVLRAAAARLVSPGEVLARVNDQLCPDVPEKMFVTCFYAVLDQRSGRLSFANAGHDVPYMCTRDGVEELKAKGMPLGLFPRMSYDEKETTVSPGDTALLYSDGLAEAHDADGDMFGFPRVKKLVGTGASADQLIERLLSDLEGFTGAGWEQEDDITLVTLQRTAGTGASAAANSALAEFTVSSAPGHERLAIDRVEEAVSGLGLAGLRLERLKTAVGEATMNAMEHGNEYREDLPVSIRVLASDARVRVEVTDHGGGRQIREAETPDLQAKLAGEQKPRGWGLFLIEKMVDELNVSTDENHHTVELCLDLKGGDDGDA